MRRGGFTSAEIRKFFADEDVQISDDTVAAFQNRWRRNASKRVNKFVIENFLKMHPVHLCRRDQLVCAHDLNRLATPLTDTNATDSLVSQYDDIEAPGI